MHGKVSLSIHLLAIHNEATRKRMEVTTMLIEHYLTNPSIPFDPEGDSFSKK